MTKKKYNWAKQTTLNMPKIETTKKSIVPVTIRECKQLICNLFAKPKYKQLKVTKSAYIKLMCYINLIGDYEISGFGRIKDETIIDFKILKQQVRAAYVECNEDAVLDFIRSVPKEQLSEWELDWHSHVNMGVHPSGTDWSNYESMSELRGHKQFPAMIINKKQEYTLINYLSEDNSPDIDLEITDEQITEDELNAIYEEAKNDIKENCTKEIEIKSNVLTNVIDKKKTFTYPTYDSYYSAYVGYQDGNLETERCRGCGTPLLDSQELATGFCEDCMQQ